jgi:hypothetical protein
MSPQLSTPFFDSSPSPYPYIEMGMVMIGLWGVSKLEKSEKGAF